MVAGAVASVEAQMVTDRKTTALKALQVSNGQLMLRDKLPTCYFMWGLEGGEGVDNMHYKRTNGQR